MPNDDADDSASDDFDPSVDNASSVDNPSSNSSGDGDESGTNRFVTNSETSWWSRIKTALVGILLGVVLIPASVIGLSWNEARSLRSAKSLQEAAAQLVSVSPDAIKPENEQRLIHLSGEIRVKDPLTDPRFLVSAPALSVRRTVKIFQWTEHSTERSKKTTGGGTENETETTYKKTWADHPVDSSKFKFPKDHTNRGAMIAPRWDATSASATLGAFRIPQDIIFKFQNSEPLVLTEANLANLPSDLQSTAKLTGAGFYFGKDPASPAVGDQKVTFHVVNPGVFTIIALQQGDSLGLYPTRAGDSILRIEKGAVAPDIMIKHAASENVLTTWLIRLGGFFAMSLGVFLILRPLQVFTDVIPFLGDLLGTGLGLIAGIVGLIGSVITVAVAWFALRPIASVALVVAAIAVGVGIRKLRNASAPKPAGPGTGRG